MPILTRVFFGLFLCVNSANSAGVAGWSEHIYLEYIDGRANNQDELRELVSKRWNEEFIVNYRRLGEKPVRDCGELIRNEITGVVPPIPRDFYLARALQVDCYAIYSASLLRDFSATHVLRDLGALIHELAQVQLPGHDSQIGNFFFGINRLRNMKCGIDMCVVQGKWGDPVYILKLKAFGDYNNDRLEDLVITASKGTSTGDPATLELGLVVTRKSENGKLEVLDLYVPWLKINNKRTKNRKNRQQ